MEQWKFEALIIDSLMAPDITEWANAECNPEEKTTRREIAGLSRETRQSIARRWAGVRAEEDAEERVNEYRCTFGWEEELEAFDR